MMKIKNKVKFKAIYYQKIKEALQIYLKEIILFRKIKNKKLIKVIKIYPNQSLLSYLINLLLFKKNQVSNSNNIMFKMTNKLIIKSKNTTQINHLQIMTFKNN